LDTDRRTALFEKVWGTIATHYLYKDFRGVDWARIKLEYQPRALTASTSDEFYATLVEMVTKLNDEHSRFLNPQDAHQEEALTTGEVYVGIGVSTIDDPQGRLVTTVFKDSPASEAGIKRRDIIVAVNGQPVDAAGNSISGPPDTPVRLQVRTPNGTQRAVTLQRRPVLEQYAPEVYRVPGTTVGYVLIQSFWPTETPQKVEEALEQFLAAEGDTISGLVVDVRSNGGGWRSVLEGLLSHFVEGEVGAFYSQDATYPLTVTPSGLYEQMKDLPIVVLVDRETKSYAEVFAAVLQARAGAQVVGINTAGNTETIYAYDLDDGSRLWVAQEGFQLPDGVNLEGRGVVPDRSIAVDWLQFSEVRDPHILKAIELIQEKRAGSN
jgi:C-terminal peptidase prc